MRGLNDKWAVSYSGDDENDGSLAEYHTGWLVVLAINNLDKYSLSLFIVRGDQRGGGRGMNKQLELKARGPWPDSLVS